MGRITSVRVKRTAASPSQQLLFPNPAFLPRTSRSIGKSFSLNKICSSPAWSQADRSSHWNNASLKNYFQQVPALCLVTLPWKTVINWGNIEVHLMTDLLTSSSVLLLSTSKEKDKYFIYLHLILKPPWALCLYMQIWGSKWIQDSGRRQSRSPGLHISSAFPFLWVFYSVRTQSLLSVTLGLCTF